MRYAVNLPQYEHFGDVHTLVQMAQEAEQAGWDAFFIWDHMVYDDQGRSVVDPWVALAAIAAHTTHLRFGTMVTPLPRRRPWKLARETVTLDHLSGGRLILGVGLGAPDQTEFGAFGEPVDPKTRAAMLDEGLDILTGLWSGEPFRFDGQYYHLDEMTFVPRPVQQPRIPIWVGGSWPRKAPLRRAARYDGTCVESTDGPRRELVPDDWRAIQAAVREQRTVDGPFDFVHNGTTPAADPAAAAAHAAAYAEAGVTWWVENLSPYAYGLNWSERWPDDLVARARDRLRAGPPRI